MKSLKLIAMMLTVSAAVAYAQNGNNAPAKVLETFAKKFPAAKNVKWDKENETEWEAEFELGGKEYSANFLAAGSWQETENEIKKSALPSEVKATIKNEFAGYKIEEAEISETADGKVYEVSLEKNESNLEVAIDASGKVIKKEVKEEEDNEN